jgi:hypothetical protein
MPWDEDYVLATAKLEKFPCHYAKNWGVGTFLFSNVSHCCGIVRKENLLDTMCPKNPRNPGVVPLQRSCNVTEELFMIPPFFPLLEG